ncbi:glycosyltransferase family protein [Psychrobacter sp. AOP1-A1-57]|uniref:glycosyltransferase family protein n=1 Tax=Psychrobacter sp. AOP1-A1-57 TaxID=3457728 RepID=UPI004036EF39
MKNKTSKILSQKTNELSGAELKMIIALIKQYGGSVDDLKYYIRSLELENEKNRLNKSAEKATISYQLGKSLIDIANRKTNIKMLSKELYAIYADALGRKNKDLKDANLFHKIIILLHEQKQKELHDLVRKGHVNRPIVEKKIEKKIEKKVEEVRAKKISKGYIDKLALQSAFSEKKIKIAAIMDEFTSVCFDPEADVCHITPENWQSEILKFAPDVLFIESAWKGKDSLWQGKVSHQSIELINLIKFCDENNIRSIFWSKEDPVHFGTFLGVAELVDTVFTTDIDCIQKYKEHLGHDKVYLLCFAAQPTIHNPIEVYERQDKFNFAGSYYLKYPIRQRDFGVLSTVAQDYKGLDIFDRNFNKPHPHYQFPESYQSMIIGTLQPSEIDKAYKGYVYGININTIKQSQTMFARRVFEMLASNTIVISNYSRGVRLLFGDLVISSDESTEVSRQLKKFTEDSLTQKKYKLQGLRKVLSHHTYQHRLKYVLEKSFETSLNSYKASILVIAHAQNRYELESIVKSFNAQSYSEKELLILSDLELDDVTEKNITIYNTESELAKAVEKHPKDAYIAVFNAKDSYGHYYLYDLAQSLTYLDYSDKASIGAVTKNSYFENVNDKAELIQDKEYQQVDSFALSRSIVGLTTFKKEVLNNSRLDAIDSLVVESSAFAIDCFSYIMNGASLSDKETQKVHDDLILDKGVDFEGRLLPVSESITVSADRVNDLATYQDSGAFVFSADDIDAELIRPKSKQVIVRKNGSKVNITSTLTADKFAYIYFKTVYDRANINLQLNTQFIVNADTNMDIRSVFVFLDENKDKLSHHIAAVSHSHTMPIPIDCKYIKVGFKITGKGSSLIESINIGEKRELVNDFVGKSDTLVLAKQYPSYDDLYKYGFLHSRVRAYKKHNHIVDTFRITNNNSDIGFREFESIDVFSGSDDNLRNILKSGQVKNIFIHLIDEKMWNIVKDYRDKINITIWVHGAEIQSWKRRDFDLVGLSASEVERKKKLSGNRLRFWKKLINEELNSNITLVFVSNTFLQEVEEDLELTIPNANKMVIHNYVDNEIFKYNEKKPEDRLKLLSIRPYSGPKYGNDMTVNALLELSKYDFFKDLEVNIYGDGIEFNTINEPLWQFENVHLHKKFLNHHEIAAAHKEHGVFLNPTRWDSQGVSRDEAMSSGLVVVTNNVSAVPEFISNDIGYMFDGFAFSDMAQCVVSIVKNPKEYLEKSRKSSLHVQEKLNTKETILKELSLLSN